MKGNFFKYFITTYHATLVAFLISCFFIHKFFRIKTQNDLYIYVGLNKYCHLEKCIKYEKKSGKYININYIKI